MIRLEKLCKPVLSILALMLAPLASHAGISAAPVPEPDIMALLASGAVAAVLVARYRKR